MWDNKFAQHVLAYLIQQNIALNIGMDTQITDLLEAIEYQQRATYLMKLEEMILYAGKQGQIEGIKKKIEMLQSVSTHLPLEDVKLGLMEILGDIHELEEILDGAS